MLRKITFLLGPALTFAASIYRLSKAKKAGGQSRPQLTVPGLARSADLKDHACARDLNQRSICRIDKTGVTTWATAGIPHRAIIDHISATVRPEPEVSRSVERGRVGSANERLIAAVVAGKILERYRQWCIWVLIEVHQLDFVTDLGRRGCGVGR